MKPGHRQHNTSVPTWARASRIRSAGRCLRLALVLVICAAGPATAQDASTEFPPAGPGSIAALPNHEQPDREQRSLGPGAGTTASERAQPASTSDSAWVMQTAFALGGVLALALLGGAVLRVIASRQGGIRASLGAGGRAPAGILEVIGRYPIARGSSLVLLKLDRRILLLSQSSQGRFGAGAAFTTLCDISDPEEIASILVKSRDEEGDSMAERFRGLLSRFDRNIEAAAGEIPEGRRRSNVGGDRVELWNDGRAEIPLVDLTMDPPPNRGAGPIGSLRQRLAALRAGQGGGA